MSPFLSSFLPILLLPLEVHSTGASAFVSSPRIAGVSSTTFQTQPSSTTGPLEQQTSPINYNNAAISHTRMCASTGSGFGSSKPPKKKKVRSTPSSPSAKVELFELQELRAQLETLLTENILYQNLAKEKREELTKYVNAVVEKSDSPINFSAKGGDTMGTARFVAGVEGKSWRMVFSTNPASEGDAAGPGDLPFGSTVILRIGEFFGTEGKLDYLLKFSKQVMGLNELTAKSSCSIDIGPVNPGLFSFQYEDIKTNIFGMSNLPVGFFGMLKGRVNYIDTVWFDGERWIERTYLENGDVVYSVYVRDVEDEK